MKPFTRTAALFAILLMNLVGCTEGRPSASVLVAARPYGVVVPSRIDLNKTYPLVIVLHSLHHSGRDIERYYQFDRFVDSRGLLLV
jgi:poly(3-hydroxybutyrate) depolymerase